VVGSGRRGQTYLYWRNGLLFELPVSYLTGIGQWINSPGYDDGLIDFGRIIVPRCLECHSTFFGYERDPRTVRYARNYRLGIRCEKCHGDGRRHMEHHLAEPGDTIGRFIFNPATASRERRVDGCALCHSGARELRRPPFSYRPGDDLDLYLEPPSEHDQPTPDVHGNQVGLLQRSKCFRSSPGMSCSTCHNVHAPQRDVAAFAQKCLGCHDTTRHPMADRIGDRLIGDCVDCHMPNRKSNAIQINTPGRQVALYFRSHQIGIYPEVAEAILRSAARSDSR
jgi:Cytochrome c554 and c-prime